MKQMWFQRFITAVTLLCLTAMPLWAAAKKDTGDKVAEVNGKIITRAEFDHELKPVQKQMSMGGASMDEARLAEMKQNILKNMIERELLYQESIKNGFKEDEEKVAKQIEQIKARFPDEKKFKELLTQMDTTEETLKDQIRKQQVISDFIEAKVVSKIKIEDADTKAYYDKNPQFFKKPGQIRASHILIKLEPEADEAKKSEAKKKINDIHKKAAAGEDFGELAKKYSEGPSNVKGGDLGLFGQGQMVKPFEDAAMALKIGEISNVVETRFGYHIIKLTEKVEESVIPYKDAKPRIEQVLRQQQVKAEMTKFIEDLKKDAKIETFM